MRRQIYGKWNSILKQLQPTNLLHISDVRLCGSSGENVWSNGAYLSTTIFTYRPPGLAGSHDDLWFRFISQVLLSSLFNQIQWLTFSTVDSIYFTLLTWRCFSPKVNNHNFSIFLQQTLGIQIIRNRSKDVRSAHLCESVQHRCYPRVWFHVWFFLCWNWE